MPDKWRPLTIEIQEIEIDTTEHNERLEMIVGFLYNYFSQLKEENPTADLDNSNLLEIKNERSA